MSLTALHALLILIIAINLGPILFRLFTGRSLLFNVVRTDSMNPALRRGDLVISQTHLKDLQEGIIILYQDPEKRTIIHRVAEIRQEGHETVLITKGDSSPGNDPPVKLSDVLGVMIIRIPFLAYPLIFLS